MLLVTVLLVVSSFAARSQTREVLRGAYRKNGESTVRAVDAATERAAQATVEILVDGDRVGLGTVVSREGHIAAKASELGGQASARLNDGRILATHLVGVDADTDLALLRVIGAEIDPVRWVAEADSALGQWVVAPGPRELPRLGIVSAAQRGIPRAGGALGVRLAETSRNSVTGVAIAEVYSGSAAEAAGLEEGDIIQSVDGEMTGSIETLVERIKRHDPGDQVRLRLVREGEEHEHAVVLGYRSVFDTFDRNQRMSGETSRRRNAFEEVIQHTVPLPPDAMGGPLVNLEGEALGINIARADRVTTYALPAELVNRVIPELMAPAPTLPWPELASMGAGSLFSSDDWRSGLRSTISSDRVRGLLEVGGQLGGVVLRAGAAGWLAPRGLSGGIVRFLATSLECGRP